MIYLDWAASAPMYPDALEELRRCAEELYANPGGVHAAAGRARAVIQSSRRLLAELLGAPDSAVYFCSGGTEANNWAVRCGAGREGGHLLIGACEHKSVLESARSMRERGFEVTLLYPDAEGRYNPDRVEAAIRPDTRLISLQGKQLPKDRLLLSQKVLQVVLPPALHSLAHRPGPAFAFCVILEVSLGK